MNYYNYLAVNQVSKSGNFLNKIELHLWKRIRNKAIADIPIPIHNMHHVYSLSLPKLLYRTYLSNDGSPVKIVICEKETIKI